MARWSGRGVPGAAGAELGGKEKVLGNQGKV